MSNDIMGQLMQLKAMTVRTGVIHEAQALQLRNYPLLIPGVKAGTVNVDPDNHRVYFNCEGKGKGFKQTKAVRGWCAFIKRMVRTILWDDSQVYIKVGDRMVFNDEEA